MIKFWDSNLVNFLKYTYSSRNAPNPWKLVMLTSPVSLLLAIFL